MQTLRTRYPLLTDTWIEESALYANFAFFWVDGMYGFFEGLRGEKAEEHFFEVNYESCTFNQAAYEVIPDADFASLFSLANARLRPLPVLSKSEFEKLKLYVGSVHSHSHSVLRASRLLKQLYTDLSTAGYKSSLEALALRPELLYSLSDGSSVPIARLGEHNPTSLSVKDLQGRASNLELTTEPGYLCPDEQCLLISGSDFLLEVIARRGIVLELRTTLNTSNQKNIRTLQTLVTGTAPASDFITTAIENVRGKCHGFFNTQDRPGAQDFVYVNRALQDNRIYVQYLNPQI